MTALRRYFVLVLPATYFQLSLVIYLSVGALSINISAIVRKKGRVLHNNNLHYTDC